MASIQCSARLDVGTPQERACQRRTTHATGRCFQHREWEGLLPVYLYLIRPDNTDLIIDVEKKDWMKTHADWMRGRSRWYLMAKADKRPLLAVDAMDGDQPYYAAKHIHRIMGRNAGASLVAYGIGAKRKDGHTDRMWVLPNGIVCAGEDVMSLGEALLG